MCHVSYFYNKVSYSKGNIKKNKKKIHLQHIHIFIEKYPRVSGPEQLRSTLFKGPLYCISSIKL